MDLPDSYWDHAAVVASQAAGEPLPLPLSLYIDGVPFTKHESFLGFWILNVASGVRRVVALLRKGDLCRCGCRGWCSIFPIWQFLTWSLSSLAQGVFPSARHDAAPWPETDAARQLVAGKPLGFRAVVVFVKGDWLEFSSTLGFMSWATAATPCMFCEATRDDMFDFRRFSALDSGWPEISCEAYEQHCRAAEVWAIIDNEAQLKAIVAALHFDKRKQGGSAGRALTISFPALGLEAGDRLEPSQTLQDIALFDQICIFSGKGSFLAAQPAAEGQAPLPAVF
jgi:hypothetical protein